MTKLLFFKLYDENNGSDVPRNRRDSYSSHSLRQRRYVTIKPEYEEDLDDEDEDDEVENLHLRRSTRFSGRFFFLFFCFKLCKFIIILYF